MGDGYLGKCKECTKTDVKNNTKDYSSSEKGVIRVLYKTQKRNNKNRGFGELPYSKVELSCWLYANNFKQLYDTWISNGKNKQDKPSPDRINDTKGYNFNNMRLVTWQENHRKAVADRVGGIGTQGSVCKQLLQLKDGVVYMIYPSYNSAVRGRGYNLEHSIKFNTPCKDGFYWKYSKT